LLLAVCIVKLFVVQAEIALCGSVKSGTAMARNGQAGR
jgi:hypothetical protein